MYQCPVCDADELSVAPYATWPPPAGLDLVPPYEDQLGRPSYEVCPNCGFEFGNDDNPGTATPMSFLEYYEAWCADGSERFDRKWEPALLISGSGLWLGRLAGRWVVGRRNGYPSEVSGHPISLLVLLERDWSVAQLEIADLELSSPGMEPISLFETVRLALSPDVSAHWTSKAIDWLQQGFPREGLRPDLERVVDDRRLSQRTRHGAERLLRTF